MRLLRFLVTYVIVTVLGGVLLLFLALNHYTVQLDVFGPEYSVSIALLMLGAAALGFVVAMLIVLPGRIASAVNARRLDRELRYLEQDVMELQEMRARLLARHDYLVEGHERILLRYHSLLADHSRVVSERDEAREQLAAVRAARPIAAAAGRSSTPLRLLAPASATPSPAARPTEETPAARVSAQVASDEPRVERREAQPEPPRAKPGVLLPMPIGAPADQPQPAAVPSLAQVEAPPAEPVAPVAPPVAVVPVVSPVAPRVTVTPDLPAAASMQSVTPETPPTQPARRAGPRKPLVQPALALRRARRKLAVQSARIGRGMSVKREEIQRGAAQLRDQLRPRLASLRAGVADRFSQVKQRLTPTHEEPAGGDEEQGERVAPRVAAASRPLGE